MRAFLLGVWALSSGTAMLATVGWLGVRYLPWFVRGVALTPGFIGYAVLGAGYALVGLLAAFAVMGLRAVGGAIQDEIQHCQP